MKNTIHDLYLILRRRMSDEEILKISEVRSDILQNKIKVKSIGNDQMALSIYFKMYSKVTNNEISLLKNLERDDFS
jgi:hypothetical protein